MNVRDMQALVERVTAPSAPPIYKRLYGQSERAIRAIEDWHALPPLTKEVLQATPLRERLFVPLRDVFHGIYVSSGTSGRPPIVMPRARLDGFGFSGSEYGRVLLSSMNYPHRAEHYLRKLGRAPRVVALDPKRVTPCVRLAKAAGVDGMYVYPFLLPEIGRAMQAIGYAHNITRIACGGEHTTTSLLTFVRQVFPRAELSGNYGMSEVEDSPVGELCHALTPEAPVSLYHPKEHMHIDLAHPESGIHLPLRKGSVGELLLTSAPPGPLALPLIRYRTGDLIEIVEEACATHGKLAFRVLGRAEEESLKIEGGVLLATEVRRVLRSLDGLLSDEFELHHREHETADGPRPEITLCVERRGTVNFAALAREIAERLRVGPAYTYARGVAEGRYLPLRCEPFLEAGGRKRRRLVKK